jgi:hypothetical protein
LGRLLRFGALLSGLGNPFFHLGAPVQARWVSYFAQNSGGQKCRLTGIETPSQSVRSLIAEPETHTGVRGLASKHVGRKDIPCKYSILQGESLKRLLQGAAAGAAATIVVGFYWGGWSLGSTADKMAKDRSDLAVVAALAPVCADKFRALPDAEAKTVALSKAESWKRAEEFPRSSLLCRVKRTRVQPL